MQKSRKRFTTQEYKNKLKQLVGSEFTLISEYTTVRNMCTYRHNSTLCDNHEFSIQANRFDAHPGCPKCRSIKGSPSKLSHEQFAEMFDDIAATDYTLLSMYNGANNPITVRHNNDECENHIFTVKASTFIHNGTGCPICAKNRKLTQKQVENKIYSKVLNTYTVDSEYKGAFEPLIMRHHISPTMSHTFTTTFQAFYHANVRCPICQNRSPRFKTADEFYQLVQQLVGDTYTILDPFVNKTTPLRFKHNCDLCDHSISLITPSQFINHLPGKSYGYRCKKCGLYKRQKAFAKNNKNFYQKIKNTK